VRKAFKTAIAGAVMCTVATQAWAAAAPCARPIEMQAIRTAAIQQELMVAALSCDAVPRYNQFVTHFQGDLQAADRALQAFFRRMNARTGTADYHAFKTRMANASSRKSIAHITNFCDGAEALFVTALDTGPVTLATFVSAQSGFGGDAFSACDPNAPVIAYEAPPPREPPTIAMIPRMKPVMIVEPARGLVLRTSLDLSASAF
jgi:hypothetical protein